MAQPNNNQMAFWEAMKQKYERRNENLKQQEICLKQRLEQLKQLMENQQAGDDCDCVPEKLEKPSLVQCLVEKGKNLILGSCKCGDPKIGEEFLCACHITNPRIPLNVSSDLCPSTPTEDGCSNSQCDFYNQQLSSAAEDPSTFSLKTTDIYYMNKLSELVNAERCMQEKIEDLENREHSYISAIQDIQELMKKKPKEDPMKKEFNRMAEGMEEENKNLKNELENLKLELKHCFERVEGPLRRSLEEQKDKCLKMEKELKDFQTKMASKEDGYLKEINEIKAKLCQACCTMVDLNTVNSKLKDDLNSLQNKCEGLEDDLLKQQLREAENILKFKNALSRRGPQIDTLNRGDDTEQELGHIARKLSETLNEVCPCVTNVPSGLTETVQNIKQLTDLVGEKEVQRKKRKGKLQSCSCTFSANEGQQTIPTKPRSIVNCACSTSSLRLNPTTTQDIRPGTDAFQSCSSSISLMSTPTTGGKSLKPQVVAQANKELTKETTSIGCSCCEIQDACEPQSKPEPQATMKSEDTICLCPDVQSEIVGPSEEVIAVKHLGTLGVSPAEAAVQAVKMLGALHSAPPMKKKKERLQVDTTCDVLSVPAEDIHIVTTIAKTGSLEITTEGPPGIIETKVNYLADGKIEIVTKLIDHKNMETFLDGTLLHVQEEPQCNESQTCEGQCSPHPKICSDTTNCDLVNACVPECDGSEKKGAAFNLEKEKVKEPTGSVLFREKAIIPKNLSEWKNDRFDDSSEEKEPTSLVCEVEPVRRRKARLVEDVTDSNHDLPKALKLSSKPSLTDVEKYLQVESQDDSSASSTSYIYPDVLETISEGDEDEDSSKADLRNQSEGAMVIEKREELCNDKMEPLVEIDRIICDYADDESESSSAETVIEDQGSMVTGSGDAENSINKIGDTLQIKEAEETISSIRLSVVLTSSDISKNTLEEPQLDSLFEKNDFTAVNNEEKSENRLEIEDTISLCELYRNFGSVNLLRGNFQLKQSKSMFERKSYYAECLRVSKSAVLCFGNLKIDLENIKFFSGVPNVGDFDESNLEGRKRVDNVLLPVLPVQGVRTSSYLKAVEEFFAEDKREGCSCFGTTQVIPDQTYQCYVCTCSNKKDASQNTNNLRNEQNLEQRIDRLLEINPLATSHGPDCQCVDCLVHNAQSHVPRSEPQLTECKCSKRLEDIAKRIDPSKYRCKCNFKKKEEAITVKNVALIYGTPKHEGDNTQHDKNCTCVDCICNPCHFKKGKGCDCGKCDCSPCCDSVKNPLADLTLFKFQEPPEITVMNVRIPCDCAGQCLCNPCMDNSKKPQPKSQFQAKAQIQERSSQPERSSCKKCSERVSGQQSVQTKTSSQSTRRNKADMGTGSSRINTKPSAQDQPSSAPFSGADTWKTVVGCACVPAEEKKAVCDCKVCECKPCAYAEKARAPCDCHPPKKEPKAPKGKPRCC
ncbi:hypothetical protein HHI36_018702 [Cryptolaemus montrouzieri]|uniref:Uncharacterized protein n=1 Tax=Cryptolaemus montrouzieri TaxID=559131 RepID=A0ABD2P1F9_9CUCU